MSRPSTPAAECAFGDFDNDSDVDVLVWNMNEPPSLLRNDVSGDGRWLKVLLVGTTSRPERHRRTGHGHLRHADAGPGRDRAIELLLGQRPPPPPASAPRRPPTRASAGRTGPGQLAGVDARASWWSCAKAPASCARSPCGSAPRYRRARSGCRLVRAGRERERLPVVVAEHPALVQRADRDVVRAGIAEGLPFGREGAQDVSRATAGSQDTTISSSAPIGRPPSASRMRTTSAALSHGAPMWTSSLPSV